MITYYQAALKDTPAAEEAELVFLGQDWEVGKLSHPEEHLRMILASRWTVAVWKRWEVTKVSTSTAPLMGDPQAPAGPVPGDRILAEPRLIKVSGPNYLIDQAVLRQSRDDKMVLEHAKKALVNPRNLKPGCMVTDGLLRGELTRVEFSKPGGTQDPQRRLVGGLLAPPVRLEPELIELEWFIGDNTDLGTLDELIDF